MIVYRYRWFHGLGATAILILGGFVLPWLLGEPGERVWSTGIAVWISATILYICQNYYVLNQSIELGPHRLIIHRRIGKDRVIRIADIDHVWLDMRAGISMIKQPWMNVYQKGWRHTAVTLGGLKDAEDFVHRLESAVTRRRITSSLLRNDDTLKFKNFEHRQN